MVEWFDPNSGRCVVSLSEIHLPPKSTGNTQELFTWTLSKKKKNFKEDSIWGL